MFLLNRCFAYHYGNEEKMKNVKEICRNILEENKYGPLTQTAAGMILFYSECLLLYLFIVVLSFNIIVTSYSYVGSKS